MSGPPQPLGLVEKIIERGFIVFDSYAKARKTNHCLLYTSVLIKKPSQLCGLNQLHLEKSIAACLPYNSRAVTILF